MVHQDQVLALDQTSASAIADDVLLETHQEIGFSIHTAAGSYQTAIAVQHTQNRHFVAIESQTNEGTEKGVHARRIAAAAENGHRRFGEVGHGSVSGGDGRLSASRQACKHRYGQGLQLSIARNRLV